ncbi:TPA: hypothetical protein KDY52_003804 [Vibrio parahaemolyticus]|nr:hypothetical protein [Vibrio parahaemolyticus]
MSSTKKEELNKFEVTVWRTNISSQVDEFRRVLNEGDNSEKYFNKEFLEKMIDKSSKLNQSHIKYTILYLFVIFSLYSTLNVRGIDIEFGPLSLKNIDKYKEFLLFVSSILLPVSITISLYNSYIVAIVRECVEKLAPEKEIHNFYKHAWLDSLTEGLFKSDSRRENIHDHGFSLFLIFTLILLLIFIVISFLLAGFFVHLAVIYDVAFNPVTPGYINKFVVFFSIISVLYSFLVIVIQLPLPEVDYSNFDKIKKLETENPEEYIKVMKTINKNEDKKEVYSLIIFISFIYMITYISSMYFMNNFELPDIVEILPKATTGSIMVLFVSSELYWLVKKLSYKNFFKSYPDESSERLQAYKKIQNRFKLTKLITPFVITIIYICFF